MRPPTLPSALGRRPDWLLRRIEIMNAESGHQLARGENVTSSSPQPPAGALSLGWVEVKLGIKHKYPPIIGMGRAAGRVKVRPIVAGIGGDILKTLIIDRLSTWQRNAIALQKSGFSTFGISASLLL
jgi:hypothetical protein